MGAGAAWGGDREGAWGRGGGYHGGGGGGEIVPTTIGTPIPQPEARYHNQKLDPTTTEQLFYPKQVPSTTGTCSLSSLGLLSTLLSTLDPSSHEIPEELSN